MKDLGQVMRDASICGLGQTASSAVESAIFRLSIAGPDEPIVYYVGRLVPEKGLWCLIDAVPLVLRERPGVKFKDADLIGVPCRVTLGKRKFEQGQAEIFERATKQIRDVKLERVVEVLKGEYLR